MPPPLFKEQGMTADEQTRMISALKAGRTVERRTKGAHGAWHAVKDQNHAFNFEDYEYRMRPTEEDGRMDILNEFYQWYYSYRDSLAVASLERENFENAMLELRSAYFAGRLLHDINEQ